MEIRQTAVPAAVMQRLEEHLASNAYFSVPIPVVVGGKTVRRFGPVQTLSIDYYNDGDDEVANVHLDVIEKFCTDTKAYVLTPRKIVTDVLDILGVFPEPVQAHRTPRRVTLRPPGSGVPFMKRM